MNHIALALVIALLWGSQPILNRQLMGKYDPATIMLFSSVIYTILVMALCFRNSSRVGEDLGKLTRKDLLILVGLPVVTIFFANLIYFHVLKNHKTSVISAIMYSAPAFTLAIAYLFYKEKLSPSALLGIGAILAGLFLLAR
jgi:drug/metabolite transporter (DMT)-like permease